MSMIRLINLTKAYRGLRAVDRVNLEVGEGKVFGFLGSHGGSACGGGGVIGFCNGLMGLMGFIGL